MAAVVFVVVVVLITWTFLVFFCVSTILCSHTHAPHTLNRLFRQKVNGFLGNAYLSVTSSTHSHSSKGRQNSFVNFIYHWTWERRRSVQYGFNSHSGGIVDFMKCVKCLLTFWWSFQEFILVKIIVIFSFQWHKFRTPWRVHHQMPNCDWIDTQR